MPVMGFELMALGCRVQHLNYQATAAPLLPRLYPISSGV